VFGQSERHTVCAQEDSREPAFAQALHLMNGETVTRKVETSPVLSPLMQRGAPMQEIAAELYLRTLGRNPSAEELMNIERISGPKPQRRDYEHLWWALFNSTEFLFQH
jgi:hypothetical protein